MPKEFADNLAGCTYGMNTMSPGLSGYGAITITPPNGKLLGLDILNRLKASDRTETALRKAEAFISGFEDDDMQEGVNALLNEMRAALLAAEGQAA